MMMFRKVTFLIAVLTVLCGVAGAAVAADDLIQARGPVEVTADHLEVDDRLQTMTFSGNAVATQGDVSIRANRLTLHYTGTDREIEQLQAEGQVRIVQGTRTATADRATLYQDEERVVLTGSPRVAEGDNFVQGQEITIYLNDRRSTVTGGEGGRVNAVFTPPAEKQP
jgi:lipopolysaccharide export system protein LptA